MKSILTAAFMVFFLCACAQEVVTPERKASKQDGTSVTVTQSQAQVAEEVPVRIVQKVYDGPLYEVKYIEPWSAVTTTQIVYSFHCVAYGV